MGLDGEDGFCDVSAMMRSGIYVLVRKGEVVYVGQSRQLYVRVYQHAMARGKLKARPGVKPKLKVGFAFDEVHIRFCALGELDALEKALIEKYKPKHNVAHNPQPPMALSDLIKTLTPIPAQRPAAIGFRRRA